VSLERALGLISAAKRAIGTRQRVVRGAPFGEQRDGAFQVRHGRLVVTIGHSDSSESELGCRLGRRFAA